jgi:PIN domain nuclease of toxin-antitoxin system
MKVLLDTHAFIWAVARSRLLSPRAARLIRDPANIIQVSAVSAYEIEFKRLRDPVLAELPTDLDEVVTVHRFEWLALRAEHAMVAGRLPRLHGDPFDRMLAAQALVERATVITRDPLVAAYGAVVLW